MQSEDLYLELSEYHIKILYRQCDCIPSSIRACEASPIHTCLIEIVVDIICLEKIRGPGAGYGGVMRGQSFGAESEHALTNNFR